ncbi:hypothetical protein EYF80_002547 [Liparis tanakae]|uniref:Uncharacterized protein n=1 Tax=Liparis tanakae TaxID=230148 RepID=A0A4Z2JAZ6_9TELE|nr:hypothetical protein EYF80_002547 [Liparis tanakae]
MAKRTVSSYFLPEPHDIEKTNPQNESDSDCEETVLAKKGRKFSFRDEWLREFTWLRDNRELEEALESPSCSPFTAPLSSSPALLGGRSSSGQEAEPGVVAGRKGLS